ncbi:hypothetical protein SOVF_015100 [Spinacia oleracea]|uniref:Zinc-ribbon 15 domain-containing protein n=1 Tax=Spinacia oleracea TaxID=3562 RepID=A0A9R0IXD8_SPIOL|nr:uncharacterized protein LOC110796514 [Spinacia oleracea]KNA24514.1 hypothetical protein SOVF_015100 [Spinacia oleracea]
MFFFFVGGVEQQVGQVLKTGISRCISCNSKADLVKYDNVLKVFFVPVWKWPGKKPLLHCNTCNLFFPESFSIPPATTSFPQPGEIDVLRCQSCARVVEAGYRFCPFCGVSL